MQNSEFHHTGDLEQYHSVMLKYVPKWEHFSYNGMLARTQLAILDHNNNVNRKQSVVKNGSHQGEKRYKEIKEQKSYHYIKTMTNDVLLTKQGHNFDYQPVIQAKCIAPISRPPKEEVIQQHQSRMAEKK